MRKFIFSMQALLDVKEAAEKQAKADFAAAQRAADEAEQRCEACRREILSEHTALETDARNGMQAVEYQQRRGFLVLLEKQADSLRQALEQARRTVAEKQAALREIYKDKKALERLRASKKAAFEKEEAQKEAKEMDDLLTPGMMTRMAEAKEE